MSSRIPLVRHPYVNGVRWALLRWMDIPDADAPMLVYLRRLIIFKTPWFGIYLHWIFTTDEGRHPHNHPMVFWSMVLLGGYEEVVVNPCAPGFQLRKRWGRFSVHSMGRNAYHAIRRLFRVPTLTLVVTFKRFDDWGYLTPFGSYHSSKASDGRVVTVPTQPSSAPSFYYRTPRELH